MKEVFDCIKALGETPRFPLHCALLGPGQRAAGLTLVGAIEQAGLGESEVLLRVRTALS